MRLIRDALVEQWTMTHQNWQRSIQGSSIVALCALVLATRLAAIMFAFAVIARTLAPCQLMKARSRVSQLCARLSRLQRSAPAQRHWHQAAHGIDELLRVSWPALSREGLETASTVVQ